MAASIPHQHCSDYSFSSLHIPAQTSDMFNTMNMVPFLNYDDINSPVSSSFPDQQFGVSDLDFCMVVPQIDMGSVDYHDQQYQVQFEPEEECPGLLLPNFWPAAYPIAPENQEIIGKRDAVTKVEEMREVKVGRYSVEERKDRILRYLKKRNQRNFNKTIKYACRKTLADKRVRVRGRFAKKNEPCEEMNINTSHDTCDYEQNYSFYQDCFQMMKYEEDYWLEAAMDNLVHLPYLAS